MNGDPRPLEELRQILERRREFHQRVRPDIPVPERVLFAIHEEVPAGVVKAVVASAATAGFQPSFMVQKIQPPLR